ncbi:MAG: LTA synthase family protein [Eubacterium sp.]|nr:LTA synthase family protein [Eubacterium sp.]
MRNLKTFVVCFCYSLLLVFLMNGLISNILFEGSYILPAETLVLNIGLAFLLSTFVVLALGEGLGGFALFILTLVLLIGNIIKLVFHNTVLRPADFALMEELLIIGVRFVQPWHIALGVFVTAVLVFLIIRFRKAIFRGIIPKPRLGLTIIFLALIVLSDFIINDETKDADTKTRLETEGFTVFNYINFRDMFDMYPQEPEGYSEEAMTELKTEFQGLSNNTVTDVQPDVVVVMMESYFDIGSVEGFGLTEDVTKYGRKYNKGYMISPKYGGGTASTEFEALTGFSSAFLPEGIVPYNIYMKGGDKEVPSIVREFNKNGYETTAVHPSEADCYSRDKAYNELGFQRFLTIEDFDVEESEMTEDKMTKDYKVRDKIFEILEEADTPEFIFAVTFESHCPYYNKYKSEDIEFDALGEGLSGSNIKEILQYSRCAEDAAKMVDEICEYVSKRERPTVVICFGDHLPPLGGFSKIDYLSDLYQKYSTPIMVYSNYKEISDIPEGYISPSYLASYIINQAEISHSSYFDFISEAAETAPILNRDFGINYNDENVEKYKLLQYDLFFGEKYLEE